MIIEMLSKENEREFREYLVNNFNTYLSITNLKLLASLNEIVSKGKEPGQTLIKNVLEEWKLAIKISLEHQILEEEKDFLLESKDIEDIKKDYHKTLEKFYNLLIDATKNY